MDADSIVGGLCDGSRWKHAPARRYVAAAIGMQQERALGGTLSPLVLCEELGDAKTSSEQPGYVCRCKTVAQQHDEIRFGHLASRA